MSSESQADILSRLMGNTAESGEASAWSDLAASDPEHERDVAKEKEPAGDDKLNGLLQRINQLTAGEGGSESQDTAAPLLDEHAAENNLFIPLEPGSLRDAGLSESEVESLVLKLMLSRGDLVGRDIGDHIRLPFVLVEEVLRQMKSDQLLVYRGSAAMNDYVYQLTDLGRERARRHSQHCSYFGAAPVTLPAYIAGVEAQSLEQQRPTNEDLKGAFQDLLINPAMLSRLGPAINSGRGLFLYGSPGNGKTSIAERVTRAFGQTIWIPRTIGVDGEIIRLFDPMNHEEVPLDGNEGLLNQSKIDRRWVRIRRPTIVVGGELTMDNLEVSLNSSTGISEAPLQMKSNCGTLVIDDFGRQQMSTDELLNRWIVPLEKRYDFLNLANGKKIQVPFDQLIIFSTNLEPRDLVDDAFLRRIPYKIEVPDPSEDEFRQLFRMMCDSLAVEYNDEAIDYLVDEHYREVERPLRCCQPRDLLLQVCNRCRYERRQPMLTPEELDFAVENYFAIM